MQVRSEEKYGVEEEWKLGIQKLVQAMTQIIPRDRQTRSFTVRPEKWVGLEDDILSFPMGVKQ